MVVPKFLITIGYGETQETVPGVWVDQIIEKTYYADIIKNTRQVVVGEYVNNSLTLGNVMSIVADAYAIDHFFNIRYLEWGGGLWTVREVEVQHPRLILRLGEIYNGPKA